MEDPNNAIVRPAADGFGAKTPWHLFALLLMAAVWLYRTPYSASDLPVPPDTVEYALAPLQFVETGRYEIVVEGRGLPPRYPPWFPLSVILPAYILFGHEPGNAILPITAFAVAGVGFAWAIARRISSPAGAVLAGVSLLFVPTYTTWAGQVMTDVPCTALMLAGCLLFLHLMARTRPAWWYLLAGTLLAVTTLFRPVCAAMLLPFAMAAFTNRRSLFLRLAALLTPLLAAMAATFAYNFATFGSISRNGYKLWAPVPVDYPWLMFSRAFVPLNLVVITHTALPVALAVLIVAYSIARRKTAVASEPSHRGFVHSVIFFALATIPISLFHLIYFFPSDRFHLPILAGTAVLAAAAVGMLLSRMGASMIALLLGGVLALAVAGRITVPEPVPIRRSAAERVRMQTPDNAMVISSIDPVYMERMGARGSARHIVPLSRDVEYASKVLAWKRIDHPDPAPRDWRDPQLAAFVRAGAQLAVQFVAAEQLDAIAAMVAEGAPVFLETSSVSPRETDALAEIQTRFNLLEQGPHLYQLKPR